MKQRKNFTLVEILMVVGIILLLAGLLLPAVIGARQKAAIVQAKSDMAAILMALKNVETTYGKMVVKSSSKVTFNGKDAKSYDSGNSFQFGEVNSEAQGAYDALIAELTVPNNTGLSSLNINTRKLKFLDPKPKFDNSAAYTTADNKKQLWLDPWGNRYTIIINTDYSDSIPNPIAKGAGTAPKLSAKAVIYSWGPNGQDNDAKNVLVDTTTFPAAKTDDDVASWNN